MSHVDQDIKKFKYLDLLQNKKKILTRKKKQQIEHWINSLTIDEIGNLQLQSQFQKQCSSYQQNGVFIQKIISNIRQRRRWKIQIKQNNFMDNQKSRIAQGQIVQNGQKEDFFRQNQMLRIEIKKFFLEQQRENFARKKNSCYTLIAILMLFVVIKLGFKRHFYLNQNEEMVVSLIMLVFLGLWIWTPKKIHQWLKK